MANNSEKDKHWYWTKDLSVGVNDIDDDHKMMFQLFNEAYSLSKRQHDSTHLYRLVSELVSYTESHFKREEAIMAASAYPYCENHFAIHKQLIKQIKQQFLLVEAGQQSSADFVVFLKDWFIEHIEGTDQRISSYIAGYEESIAKAIQKVGPLTIPNRSIVYLVDDDESYLELMQAMTDVAGFNSVAFSSGEQFLLAPITDNDLVVLDLNMPEKDGIEVMRDLADKCFSPTFILISGFDERVLHSAKQLAESKQLRVAKILSKPIDTEEFIDVLTEVHKQCDLPPTLKQIPDIQVIQPDNDISVDELKQALEKHELIVYFQPQVCFDDDKLSGAEVLVRWQHPVRGLVFPDQFIPLAEHHQLMGELTETVILESIKAYQQFKSAGIDTNLSINLSAQNINDLALPEKLGTLLSRHNIAPEAFTLELTESEILTDTSASLDIFNRLRMKGFSLSIDDFGTGDSSLKKLYQSPFSELKIDQHFVRRMEKDDEAVAIARICILLAKEFKMHTVAEGVETQEIWDKLKALGCDIAQGYLIAKPMPIESFLEFCRNH
ncbi:MAG: bacteriohemerythrin [Methylomarinum sp.]|nr:bacteriohemerythrin [Methylomarinum sp.]